jgi:predicted transcriptional regulator|tara:strand:+ start:1861 stop:2055 length:195 start_codon:yes stop_codon:yes gene_type:complete
MSKNTDKKSKQPIKNTNDLSLVEQAEYMEYLAWSSLQDLKKIDTDTKRNLVKIINNIPIYKAKK